MMSYDDDNGGSLKGKLIALGLFLTLSGVYHKFATTNQDILHARVLNKKTKTRLVRRRSGKTSYWATETDYYIDTDKGLIMDEGSLWDWDAEGDEYGTVVVGETYDFKVNHDKILGTNNALEVTKVDPSGATAPAPNW